MPKKNLFCEINEDAIKNKTTKLEPKKNPFKSNFDLLKI